MGSEPSYHDVVGCQNALFEWAESYDSKDWERLSRCIAPTLRVDYRAFLNKLWEDMPAAEFVIMASDPKVLGNQLLKTQHFVGATVWKQTNETEITGYHQMRVAHQKYTDESFTGVAVKGHAHGKGTMWYRKVDGTWKFAGLQPEIRWSEYDHDKIFHDGEDKFGETE
ncbi:putative Scytalone dehydratase [Seiridium unicorne]|uniref:Scytalone dehydratase n=1 Tax=Seiridium unicorne TaxID=138068 RepID=A0ABR2UTX3_9PEZI